MKRAEGLAYVGLVVCLVSIAVVGASRVRWTTKSEEATVKYEYKVVRVMCGANVPSQDEIREEQVEAELNRLAAEGWRVVSVGAPLGVLPTLAYVLERSKAEE